MTYLVIEDFKLGQDNRRPKLSLPAGSLAALTNGHITSGGDVEKRKAFVSTYSLPAGETKALAAVGGALYAFGSDGEFASGTLTVTGSGSGSAPNDTTRVRVYVDGVKVNVGGGDAYTIVLSSQTTAVMAEAIASSIRGGSATTYYTAEASGSVITITSTRPGAFANGYEITVDFDPSEPNPTPTPPTFSDVDFSGGDDGPTMPDGVNYQALVHPDQDETLFRVLDTETFNGKIYAIAEFTDASVWHYYDGLQVLAFVDNRAKGSFTVGAGTTGTSTVTSITVGGVEILGQAITYGATAAITAELIADGINSFSSIPNYTASVQDAKVFIIADSEEGATPNSLTVSVTASGVTISGTANMAGGSALAAGKYAPGTNARTVDDKMYVTAGSLMHFSGAGDPTVMDPASSSNPGAGTSNISNHAAGSEELITTEAFFNYLAIFAKGAVQLWSVFADDDLNTRAQTVKNTGTRAPQSVVSYGDSELAYLTDGGIRGLRARDLNSLGVVRELGSPIDSAVQTQLAALTPLAQAGAIAVVEPVDKRLWMIVGDKVFVYSRFTETGIKAWSVYEPGITITHAAVVGTRLYLRAGDTVYVYGGLDGDTYGGDYTVTVELPFVDGRKVASFKEFTGLDAACEGTWTVSAAFDPKFPTTYTELAIITGPTFNELTSGMAGTGYTHIAPRLVHAAAGYARLSSIALHYDVLDAG